ncbi:DUF222 domain-containing protein [Georgenia sp. MJ173]|uniref:HNH endonuclease n=1 Tax=Georgenia sunbinii TaxID=3117728 RepID=UPI002F26DD54
MTVVEDHLPSYEAPLMGLDAMFASMDDADEELFWAEMLGAPSPTPAEAAEVREMEEAAARSAPGRAGRLAAVIAELREVLRHVTVDRDGVVVGVAEAEHVDVIRALEDLKATTAATQTVLTASFDRSRREREERDGVPAARRGRGVGIEVGLARRLSPYQGRRQLGLARSLVADMPHTLTALRDGDLNERRAGLVAGETREMTPTDRAALDEDLCADPETFGSWGDTRLVAEARRTAYALAPDAMAQRVRQAETDRRVTLRPAPDGMAYLSALLPAAQAMACYASLRKAADQGRSAGDPRGRGQLMADTLVGRVTGNEVSDAVPVEVQLVMSEHTLFGDSDDAAVVPGYGTMPAQWARDLVARALDTPEHAAVGVFLRRVFTHPTTGQLVAMDSRARTAPAGLRAFIALRDGARCRTPWCDAPVRHTDHVRPHAEGGPTSAPNLQDLCEACNYAKSLPEWQVRLEAVLGRRPGTDPPSHHRADPWPSVTTTTPTGHSYTSRPPPPIGR